MARPDRLDPAAFALLERARNTISRHRMLEPEQTVVVAVSGGPDSTCLLDVLRRLPLRLHLVVAHVDHGLAPGSGETAARVAAEGSALGMDVHVARAADLEGPNLQARARDFRYEFFGIIAAQVNARRIATGHTLDDLAETTVARLIHGGGTGSLAGIRPIEGQRIHPLIEIRRQETRMYCERAGLSFIDDPANEDQRFERSFVRHKLMPLIEDRFGEGAVRAMASSAAKLREDAAALGSLSETIFKELASRSEEGISLDRVAVLALPRGLRSRLLELAVGPVRDRGAGIEAALDWLEADDVPTSEKRFSVAAGVQIAIDRHRVLVSRMPR